MTPCEAAYWLVMACAEKLRAAGAIEVNFTLIGQNEPVWKIRFDEGARK